MHAPTAERLVTHPDHVEDMLILDVAVRALTRRLGSDARDIVDEIRKAACRRGWLVRSDAVDATHTPTVAPATDSREAAR